MLAFLVPLVRPAQRQHPVWHLHAPVSIVLWVGWTACRCMLAGSWAATELHAIMREGRVRFATHESAANPTCLAAGLAHEVGQPAQRWCVLLRHKADRLPCTGRPDCAQVVRMATQPRATSGPGLQSPDAWCHSQAAHTQIALGAHASPSVGRAGPGQAGLGRPPKRPALPVLPMRCVCVMASGGRS